MNGLLNCVPFTYQKIYLEVHVHFKAAKLLQSVTFMDFCPWNYVANMAWNVAWPWESRIKQLSKASKQYVPSDINKHFWYILLSAAPVTSRAQSTRLVTVFTCFQRHTPSTSSRKLWSRNQSPRKMWYVKEGSFFWPLFHETCHQWQVAVLIAAEILVCILAVRRFVIGFCHLSVITSFMKKSPDFLT